jgi:hypothetical protein
VGEKRWLIRDRMVPRPRLLIDVVVITAAVAVGLTVIVIIAVVGGGRRLLDSLKHPFDPCCRCVALFQCVRHLLLLITLLLQLCGTQLLGWVETGTFPLDGG